MIVRSHFTRSRVGIAIVAVVACARAEGGRDPAERVVAESSLARLAVASVADGRLICTATGADPCPLHSAVANWLDKDRVALWEPGRQILLLDAASPGGRPFGRIGQGSGQYMYATAVGRFERSIAVVDLQRSKLVRYKSDGAFEREDNIPRPDANSAPGFVGSIPVLQTIHSDSDSGTARIRLQVLRTQTERSGTTVLDVPVPWLRLMSDQAIGAAPLFPASPRYALDTDESIVWTPGDVFRVQRRSFDGKVRWTLTSDRAGIPVTADDIARRREEITRTAPQGFLKAGDLDSMTAHTAKVHPVVGGFVVEPRGRILVAGAATPSRDSVEYLVLTRDGVPTHRFALSSRAHPLLFAGDSLLVHRPTEGEPWEVRWLVLKFPR